MPKRESDQIHAWFESMFKCNQREFTGLIGHAISDLVRYEEPTYSRELEPVEGDRAAWWGGPSWAGACFDTAILDELKLEPNSDPVDAWKAALLRAAFFDALIEQLTL